MSRSSDSILPWNLVLDEIDEGVSDARFDVATTALGVENEQYEFDGPVRAQVTIGRALQTFSVQGTVTSRLRGECSRCLAPAATEVSTEFRLLVQRKEAGAEELEAVEDEEEMLVVDPGVKEVSLLDAIRDAVVLEMPLRIHCRHDCRGLCGRCGADLNDGPCNCGDEEIDPRWAALQELKSGT